MMGVSSVLDCVRSSLLLVIHQTAVAFALGLGRLGAHLGAAYHAHDGLQI